MKPPANLFVVKAPSLTACANELHVTGTNFYGATTMPEPGWRGCRSSHHFRRLRVSKAVVGWLTFACGALFALAATGTEPESRIAYLAVVDGFWQVWEMAADGSGQHQVTTSPGDKLRVSWFPSGESLLVASHMGRTFRVDVSTGEEREVDLPVSGVLDGVVSPDGQWIAYSVSPPDTRDENDIWLSRSNGTHAQKFAALESLQHQPVFSPDGKTLYFLSGDGKEHHDIWRKTLDGKHLEQVTVGQHFHFGLAVAPDGSLAFSNNRTDDYEIWIRSQSGAERRLSESPGLDGHPTWSPDSQTIAFHSNRSGALNIWRIGRDGSGPEQLTDHAGGARQPQWWVPGLAVQAGIAR